MFVSGVRQLYKMVAIPGFTYRAEVWYIGLLKPNEEGNTRGLVSVTNKLRTIQHKVATMITGAIFTTAGDTLDVHTNLLPIDLLNKMLFRVLMQLCSLLCHYGSARVYCGSGLSTLYPYLYLFGVLAVSYEVY